MNSGSSIFVLHAGGLGDLVLLSPTLAALRAARPEASITLLARAPIAPMAKLGPLHDVIDKVVALPIDPYRWAAPSKPLFGALERTFVAIGSEPVELFVSAELRPTWLTWVLAAKLRPVSALTLRGVDHSRALVAAICDHFKLVIPPFRRYADARSRVHELVRYERLARALGLEPPVPPRWPFPAARSKQALKTRGLAPNSYIACFPCGAGGTAFKRWPPERFVAVLTAVRERLGGRVLAVGDAAEREELDAFAALATAAGLEVHVFAGGNDSAEELRALVASAWGYLGNDTGPAHLAAVHGVPGVTVYGGGTWPMYAPWAPGSIGVLAPLPCFGCFWDCAFGRGYCVEDVSPEPVVAALLAAVAAPMAPAHAIELPGPAAEVRSVMADASRTYRAAQADRAARLEALLSLGRTL
jgi:ADP-heptose:LPS heptosyltransferase